MFFFIVGFSPAQAQDMPHRQVDSANAQDSVLRRRLGLGPEMTYQVIRNWVIAAEGDRSIHNPTWPGKLTPLFVSAKVTMQDLNGKRVGPAGNRYVGYLGDGVFWTSANAQLSRFCTYPHEVKGGKYALLREGAEPILDLDDVSPYWDHGLGLVRRGDKVALVDSLLQLRTGFEFDLALVNPANRYKMRPTKGPQIWVCALRAADGEWKIVDPKGNLLETDWPKFYDVDEAAVNIRIDQGNWLFLEFQLPLDCFSHLPREERLVYQPSNLSHKEIFPSEARKIQFCDSIRGLRLAAAGLELRHRKGLVALAQVGGKRLTKFGSDRFEPANDGWVRRLRMVPGSDEAVGFEADEGFEDFEMPAGEGESEPQSSHMVQKVGLIRQDGKKEIPCEFDQIKVLSDWHLIQAENENDGALYDLKGNLLKKGSPFNFNWLNEELICWTIGKDVQVWDRKGKLLYQDTSYVHKAMLDGDRIWIGDFEAFRAYSLHRSDKVLATVLCSDNPKAAYRFQQAHPEIACKDCYVDSLERGLWRIGNRGWAGIADDEGKWLIDPSAGFRWISLMENGFDVEKDDLHGYANAQGKVLLQPEFDFVMDLGGGRIRLTRVLGKRTEYAEIDTEGKIVRDWH